LDVLGIFTVELLVVVSVSLSAAVSTVGQGLSITGSALVTPHLNSLTSVSSGGLQIFGTSLSSLSGLGCPHVIGDLQIIGNPNLPQTEALAKANCMSVTGTVTGNKP
jgi:hypothetical protein